MFSNKARDESRVFRARVTNNAINVSIMSVNSIVASQRRQLAQSQSN